MECGQYTAGAATQLEHGFGRGVMLGNEVTYNVNYVAAIAHKGIVEWRKAVVVGHGAIVSVCAATGRRLELT